MGRFIHKFAGVAERKLQTLQILPVVIGDKFLFGAQFVSSAGFFLSLLWQNFVVV